MRFARFALALIAGFLVEAVVLHVLDTAMSAGSLLAGLIALLAAMAVMWLIGEGTRSRYLLMITAIFSGVVFLAMVLATPMLQPVTARVLSSATAILFALFGYARFVARR